MAGLRLHRDIDPLCACACNGATDTTFTHPTGFCIQDRGLRIDDQLLYRTTGLQDCEDNFLIRLSVEVVTCESGQPQRCEYRSYLPLKDSCTFSVTIDGYAGPSGDLNADQVLYMTGIPISQAWGGINPFICRYVATCAATITGLPCDVLAVYKTSAWITCSGTNTAPCLSETIPAGPVVQQGAVPHRSDGGSWTRSGGRSSPARSGAPVPGRYARFSENARPLRYARGGGKG